MAPSGKLKAKEIFNVGVNPSHLAVTPDGRYAYVTNSNNYGITGSDSVTVLDLHRGVPETTIQDPSFNQPYRIALGFAYPSRECCFLRANVAYVCNSGTPAAAGQSGTVSVIDLATNTVTGVISGFDGPGDIAVGKEFAYVSNYGAPGGVKSGNGNTISVVDVASRQIVATVTVDLAPAALALSPCQRYLYVACYTDGNPGTGILDVVSTESNTVVARLGGFSGPFGLALNPYGNKAYITNFGSNNFAPYGTTVSVVDLNKLRVITEVEVGIQPAGIVATEDYVYVTTFNSLYASPNYQDLTMGDGTVVTICAKKNRLAGPALAVGQSPSTMALSPDGKRLYLCKYTGNTVLAIST